MATGPNHDDSIDWANRRAHERIMVDLNGRLCSSLDQNYTTMMMANLSLGGAFVLTPFPLERGTQVQLRLPSGSDGEVVQIEGEVVWTQSGDDLSGMGIRFLALPDRDKGILKALMTSFQGG